MIESDNNAMRLPKGWVQTSLGEIAEINPKLPCVLEDNTEVSFLPMKAVEELTGKFDASIFVSYIKVRKGYTAFINGDIIFAKITPCMENGKVAVVGNLKSGVGFGSTEFHVIRPFLAEFLRKYLFYYLIQESFRRDAKRDMTGSAGQLRVPAKYMQDASLPLPPLLEQGRIVARLEELFARLDVGVEGLRKVKAQLKRYRQSVLKHAFEGKLTEEWRKTHKDQIEPAIKLLERLREVKKDTKFKELPPIDTVDLPILPEEWTWTRIGEIAESMRNGVYKPKEFYGNNGVACLRMYNIENGAIVWKDVKRMILTPEEIEFYELKPGDILVNRVNSRELVGKAAAIPVGLERCVYESKNIRLRLLQEYANSKYVSFWFLVHSQNFFSRNAQQTVGMASINHEQLALMPIPLCHPNEQTRAAEEIGRLFSIADEVEKITTESIEQTDKMRQSILKMAFEGKILPQDLGDEPANKLLERIREERARSKGEKDAKRRMKNEPKQLELSGYVE